MGTQPGLLFAGKDELISEVLAALSDQSSELKKFIEMGDIEGHEKSLADGSLGPKHFVIQFVLKDGTKIMGMPDPSMTSITRHDPADPSTWVWRYHLSEHNDSIEVRYYRVEVEAGTDEVRVKHLRIRREQKEVSETRVF